MFSSVFQYFNYSKNATLTMPLCLVSNFNMFPRSYNFFDSGPKLPLTKAWLESPKSNVNPIRATKSLEFQNVSSSFVILEVLPKIFDAIDIDLDEVLPEIPDSTVINLDEIVELSDS
jgi:hypothetical protein